MKSYLLLQNTRSTAYTISELLKENQQETKNIPLTQIRVKNYWIFIKPFLTNKVFMRYKSKTLVHKNKIIAYGKLLAILLKDHYINISEKSNSIEPKSLGLNFMFLTVVLCFLETVNETEIKTILKNLD